MNEQQPSFIKDFLELLFSPRRFFLKRFLQISWPRIIALSSTGILLGVVIGNLLTLFISQYVLKDFVSDQGPYKFALDTLGLTADNFSELLKTQYAYSAMLACLSPIIAYVAPHLFGGALYFFMWTLYRPDNKFDFHRILECATIALTSMAFYMIPGIGPILAAIFIGVNTSRAISVALKLEGVLKILSIIFAMYVCFFMSSASLQFLLVPLQKYFKLLW